MSHALKDTFDVHRLDLQQVALSFGFSHPPKVELNLRTLSASKHRKMQHNRQVAYKIEQALFAFTGYVFYLQNVYTKSGHSFSSSNPKGKRGASDTRQFSR